MFFLAVAGDIEENLGSGFVVHPNPSNDEVTISISVDQKSFLIKLIDVSGRVVKEFPLENQNGITFSAADLPKGVYVVEVSSGQGKSRSKLVLD